MIIKGGGPSWRMDENLYNNFLILEVTVWIILSYYKSVKKLKKEMSIYNSSSTHCNLLISFYSFFNSYLNLPHVVRCMSINVLSVQNKHVSEIEFGLWNLLPV